MLPMLARELARATGETRGPAILALQALLVRGSDRVGGLAVLKDMLKNDLNRPEAQLAIARQQLAVDDKDGAAQSLKQALQLRPDYLPAALMLSQMGPAERAAGITSFEKYVQQNPKSRDARLALSQLYLADDRLDDAQKQFETMRKLDAKDPTPLMALALIKIQQKKLDEATGYLKQYVQLGDKQPNLDVGQATSTSRRSRSTRTTTRRRRSGSTRSTRRASTTCPRRSRARNCCRNRGKTDEARKVLDDLPITDPRDAAVVARTDASILFTAKRYPEAEARLGQAVRDFPDDPDLRYDYAMAAEKTGHYDDGKAAARADPHAARQSAGVQRALGYSLADRNQRLPEASKLIDKAMTLAPNDAYIMDSLGWVKYRMGDTAARRRCCGVRTNCSRTPRSARISAKCCGRAARRTMRVPHGVTHRSSSRTTTRSCRR